MELYIDIISNTEESVSTNKHGVREHVTFNVIARQILDKINDPPPTFIAQTKKHGEEQILKEVKKKRSNRKVGFFLTSGMQRHSIWLFKQFYRNNFK